MRLVIVTAFAAAIAVDVGYLAAQSRPLVDPAAAGLYHRL